MTVVRADVLFCSKLKFQQLRHTDLEQSAPPTLTGLQTSLDEVSSLTAATAPAAMTMGEGKH